MTIIKMTLNDALFTLLGREHLVYEWWEIPNKAFDNQTPNQVYHSGADGRQKVHDYIMSRAKGDYR